MVSEQGILDALKLVPYPGYSRDIVSFGLIKDLKVNNGQVSFRVDLATRDKAVGPAIEAAARNAVAALPGVKRVEVTMDVKSPDEPRPAEKHKGSGSPFNPQPIPGVKRVVAVASAKGGVGKSTISVNLARGLAEVGRKVGLLDLDVYGPSIPIMAGATEPPRVEQDVVFPSVSDGIELISIGFYLERSLPLIWRGPMVIKVVDQFLDQVRWSDRDVLVVDLPPGTGDAQLSLCQRVTIDGVVMVSTPQEVAMADARRGVSMFQKLGVPVFGVLENMSSLICPHCGGSVDVFGQGGVRNMAREMAVPYLGSVPLDPALVNASDRGFSLFKTSPDSPAVGALRRLAEQIDRLLSANARAPGPESGT